MEERGLVMKEELKFAREGDSGRGRGGRGGRGGGRGQENKGEAGIERELIRMGTRVERAPKGMKRSMDNATSWSKSQKCVNWQVEWVRAEGRMLSKALGKLVVGAVYKEVLEDERRKNMTDEERRMERKRRADGVKERERAAKRVRSEPEMFSLMALSSSLQDPITSMWNSSPAEHNCSAISHLKDHPAANDHNQGQQRQEQEYHFYLLRPHTPSSYPKVLIPLDQTKSISEVLRDRVVLEFPTMYVLKTAPKDLPAEWMLEDDFLRAVGKGRARDGTRIKETESGEESSESESSGEEEESETSSSGSSSEEEEALLIEEVEDDDAVMR